MVYIVILHDLVKGSGQIRGDTVFCDAGPSAFGLTDNSGLLGTGGYAVDDIPVTEKDAMPPATAPTAV